MLTLCGNLQARQKISSQSDTDHEHSQCYLRSKDPCVVDRGGITLFETLRHINTHTENAVAYSILFYRHG